MLYHSTPFHSSAYVPASSLTRPFSLVRTPGGVAVVRSVTGSVADVKLSWADAQVNTDAKDVTKVSHQT